jgi:hypothetical protein
LKSAGCLGPYLRRDPIRTFAIPKIRLLRGGDGMASRPCTRDTRISALLLGMILTVGLAACGSKSAAEHAPQGYLGGT